MGKLLKTFSAVNDNNAPTYQYDEDKDILWRRVTVDIVCDIKTGSVSGWYDWKRVKGRVDINKRAQIQIV